MMNAKDGAKGITKEEAEWFLAKHLGAEKVAEKHVQDVLTAAFTRAISLDSDWWETLIDELNHALGGKPIPQEEVAKVKAEFQIQRDAARAAGARGRTIGGRTQRLAAVPAADVHTTSGEDEASSRKTLVRDPAYDPPDVTTPVTGSPDSDEDTGEEPADNKGQFRRPEVSRRKILGETTWKVYMGILLCFGGVIAVGIYAFSRGSLRADPPGVTQPAPTATTTVVVNAPEIPQTKEPEPAPTSQPAPQEAEEPATPPPQPTQPVTVTIQCDRQMMMSNCQRIPEGCTVATERTSGKVHLLLEGCADGRSYRSEQPVADYPRGSGVPVTCTGL